MVDSSPPASRQPHVVRLAVFAVFLVAMFYLLAVKHVVDIEDVRRTVKATGPAAPLTYIVTSAVLGAIFVPGPILAASSGLLFGPALGVFVTLGATVGTAVVASVVGRRAGRDSARALLGPARSDGLDALIERHGLWAVVGQRFVPGLSDALASYAFGAFGVPLWQMAVGAFIGSVPRAFVYTALGASIGNRSPWLAYSAVAVWCVTAVAGAFAAHRGFRHYRAHDQGRSHMPDRLTGREFVSVTGQTIQVPDPERLVHLQFRRFAGCPICNLHLAAFVRRHDEITAAGIREVVFFHSPEDELREHTAGLPFATIADPTKQFYREFGVESTPRALLDPRAWGAIIRGTTLTTVGRFRAPAVKQEGGHLGLPADFLVDTDGKVIAGKYGKHANDQWSVDELLALAGDAAQR